MIANVGHDINVQVSGSKYKAYNVGQDYMKTNTFTQSS
jgi:hypothetical protein